MRQSELQSTLSGCSVLHTSMFSYNIQPSLDQNFCMAVQTNLLYKADSKLHVRLVWTVLKKHFVPSVTVRIAFIDKMPL